VNNVRRRFYDLNVGPARDEEWLDAVMAMAEHLGYRGVAIVVEDNAEWIRDAASAYKVELYTRVDIRARRLRDVRKKISKLRWADIIGVICEDRGFAREAAKLKQVDILSFSGRSIGFIDTRQINVVNIHRKPIEIVLRDVIAGTTPLYIYIEKLRKALEVSWRGGATLILSSGASGPGGMRSPRDIASIASILGYPEDWSLGLLSDNPRRVVGDML